MERKDSKQGWEFSDEIAGRRGGGFGRGARIRDTRPRAADMVDTPPIKMRGVDKARQLLERSAGEPPPSKGQLKREQRASDYEATMEQGRTERDRKRQDRKDKFGIKFYKGGKVVSSSSHVDYSKR